MNHTPTPWDYTMKTQKYGIQQAWIKAGGKNIFKGNYYGNEKANAQFIVQAVNSYQAMKEALEACRPWIAKAIEMNVQEGMVLPKSIMRANTLLNKALTLAEGKE